MLPDHILHHSYFHANLDIKTAKQKLLQSADDQGNFLFCKGNAENDIVIVYKAYFRGSVEVRHHGLHYNSVEKKIQGSSLGNHSNLIAYQTSLETFLNGWTSVPFVAKVLPSELQQIMLNSDSINSRAIPSISNELSCKIMSYLDIPTLNQVSRISKTCGFFAQKEIEKQLQRNFAAEQNEVQQQKDMIQFIIETVKKILTVRSEGQGKISDRIDANGFSICAPNQYGSQILCQISTPNFDNKWVFLNSASAKIRFADHHEPFVSKDHLNGLVELCKISLLSDEDESDDELDEGYQP